MKTVLTGGTNDGRWIETTESLAMICMLETPKPIPYPGIGVLPYLEQELYRRETIQAEQDLYTVYVENNLTTSQAINMLIQGYRHELSQI